MNGTLYTGITNDLLKRVYEHKQELVEGFTRRYHIHTLVYFEEFSDPQTAITREKQLKKWKRNWKIRLIQKNNPIWKDLYENIQ